MTTRAILSLILIMFCQIGLCEQQTFAPNSINIYPINITPPKSKGWVIEEQNQTKVVFVNKSTSDRRLAHAALFVNKIYTDKNNILEITKRSVSDSLESLDYKIRTMKQFYTDEFPYPCVRSRVFATKAINQENTETVEMPFQFRYLICVKPDENIGFTATFSYFSEKTIKDLDNEADEFINGVKFRSISNSGEINALWNTHDGFGIWVYPETGTCDEIRSRMKYFTVFGFKKRERPKSKLRIPATDFDICLDFANGKPNALCKDGYVDLEFDEATNEYRGYFELKMHKGMIKHENFRAAYCDKK